MEEEIAKCLGAEHGEVPWRDAPNVIILMIIGSISKKLRTGKYSFDFNWFP
jgi:hypothetical protein